MLISFESSAIEYLIAKLPTAQQRINARKKIKEITIIAIDKKILESKEILREMRSESESAKRSVYSEISKMEVEKNKIQSGDYGF